MRQWRIDKCMTGTVWETEESVEAAASADFAWSYMSNVANWEDPPAQFVLEGPFADGSRGVTHMPGQPLRHWSLCDVVPMKSYTIEVPLDGALMHFHWRFAPLPDGRARLTQQIALAGENAAAYVPIVQQTFVVSLRPGMERIAASIAAAFSAANPKFSKP